MLMDIVLKILTLGLYGLFTKKRSLKQSVTKVKYREDGSVKKKIERDTEYDSDESPDVSEEISE